MRPIRWRSQTVAAAIALLLAMPVSAAAEVVPQPTAAESLEGYIYNADKKRLGIAIGVISSFDGDYTHGRYDAVLPVFRRTDTLWGWNRAEAFYIGAPYCGSVEYYAGNKWRLLLRKFSPGIHYLPPIDGEKIARYQVSVYRQAGDAC
ncbi:hypothetical protein KBX50_26765 [Micromonospora sp. C51]|nr:hypothetical protein [Micromonospora sp. C51]